MGSYEEQLQKIIEKYDEACKDKSMSFEELNEHAQRIQKLLEEYTKEYHKDLYPSLSCDEESQD